MKYLAILLVSVVGFAAAASYGDYVPKAYFVIDENGNPSPAYPIDSESLNRVRRQIQPFQPFGQPGFGFAPFPNIQPGQGQGTFVSTSQTLNNRFGEDEPQVSGQTTVIQSNGNKVTQTNTYLRPDGTSYTTQSRQKRQQSQTQSQKGQGGNQIQSQTQDGLGGQQHQTQTQGQNLQTQGQHSDPIATPVAVQQPVAHGSQTPHQGGEQYAPQYEQGHTENRNQGSYPQQPQANYQPGFAPFGFGAFGPGGFPQQGFGAPGFGFPQAGFGGVGFGQPGFGNVGFGQPGFGQPGFGGVGFAQPGFVNPGQSGSSFTGISSTLDNRFGEDEVPVVTGGTQTVTSQNGNFQVVTSVLKPNGQVVTTTQNGKVPSKKN